MKNKTIKHKNNRILFNVKVIKQIILFLFIFFLPTQLGHYFKYGYSRIYGISIDYLSTPIYLTDFLFLALLITHIKVLTQGLKDILKQLVSNKIKLIITFLIIILIFLSTLFSHQPIISIYKLAKILELLFIIIILRKSNKTIVVNTFFLSGIFQLFLIVLQFINKSSIQGIFYYFGERYMTLGSPGISKAYISGIEFLRPYGTFSHPNSLAGFFLLIYVYVLYSTKEQRLFKTLSLAIYSLIIFLSFSKNAIIFYFIFNSIYFLKQKKCIICTFAKVSISLILTIIVLIANTDPSSQYMRIKLLTDSINIISKNWLLGTGLGQYLYTQSNLPMLTSYFFLQPVHNIFLLWIAENGLIVGLITISLTTLYLWKKRRNVIFIIVSLLIIFTGLFDHYWLTLQQDWLLIGVIIGISTNIKGAKYRIK